ncbi:LacI family DNA-binding transcriptional regulator [Kineococcus rubinsiae]|uniref:LacI family DNA-binding transcriptional regulator n=1 Tax=Kineococcus rubinsiae TaxID=2609562 RepID=UPI00142F81AF|nr:LacI family DNA-binding transcriptional regulator [Kineococcus rubinsiae]NIZ90503.1 LacI family transcriptional regulator [Kineococcus rubinsiae]
MARVPTSKDVARIAGVSQSTVSYVMSGKRPISARTRRLVEDAMQQLTYQPHAGARALASQRTNVIGLVVPFRSEVNAHGLMAFVEEIALSARAHDHDILMVTADEGTAGLQRLAGRSLCDALVMMEISTHDVRVPVVRALGVPALLIGLPGDTTGLHCVDFDFETGATLLVDEVADLGHERACVLAWPAGFAGGDMNYVPRFRGAAEATARRRGVELSWREVPRGRENVDHVLEEVLGGGGTPPGLVCTSQLSGIVSGLQRRGLRTGADVDLLALTTDAEAEAEEVPVSGVSTQPRDVSRRAMRTLFQLLDGVPPQGAVELVPAELTRRSSSRRPPQDAAAG